MKCKRCKGNISWKDNYCLNCGKKNNLKTISIICILICICIVISSVFLFKPKSGKTYEEVLEIADRYYENQEYEKAEEYYLKAMEIDPKQELPYQKMYEIYTVLNKEEEKIDIIYKAKNQLEENDYNYLIQATGEVKVLFDEYLKILYNNQISDEKFMTYDSGSFYDYPEGFTEAVVFDNYLLAIFVEDGHVIAKVFSVVEGEIKEITFTDLGVIDYNSFVTVIFYKHPESNIPCIFFSNYSNMSYTRNKYFKCSLFAFETNQFVRYEAWEWESMSLESFDDVASSMRNYKVPYFNTNYGKVVNEDSLKSSTWLLVTEPFVEGEDDVRTWKYYLRFFNGEEIKDFEQGIKEDTYGS